MKRISLLLLSLFISLTLYAQDHLTFKGIPIDGPLSAFVEQMKAAGFTLTLSTTNGVAMEGTFAGFDDCTVLIVCTANSKTVWKVAVKLPVQNSWSSARYRYADFKDRFTDKYGKPSDCFEFFMSPYEEGDGYELQAIGLEKGHYSTYWQLPGGIIAVEISASNNTKGWVQFTYEDNQGASLKEMEQNRIINNDI